MVFPDNLDDILRIVQSNGGLTHTDAEAKSAITDAKQCVVDLPDSASREAMLDLAEFCQARTV